MKWAFLLMLAMLLTACDSDPLALRGTVTLKSGEVVQCDVRGHMNAYGVVFCRKSDGSMTEYAVHHVVKFEYAR